MEFNELIQMISSTGFPIVMCLLMFKNNIEVTQMISKNTEAINALKDSNEALKNSFESLNRRSSNNEDIYFKN